MSSSKKPLKIVQKLIRQVWQMSRTITKKLMSFLLRGLLVLGRKSPRFSGAGFILPTVAMVLLVVALLTTAIVFRSMDRTKNASNVRINEKVLAAVSPAVDRAEAKVVALLADPALPRSTPTDQALYQAMTNKLKKYTLGDETPLKLVNDFGDGAGGRPNGSIEGDPTAVSLDNLESLSTAWRFPVDTDNNGSFDSYSLYGIYFRNPTQSVSRDRARSPLEARNPPVDNASANRNCGGGTAASLVGASGWYKTSDGNLKKSFFVFAATVPITDTTGLDPAKFEEYKGNKGFAALEVQQDQARVPLSNNAVVYDDDLEITPGAGIKLNGRIMTNSNFFISKTKGADVHFYQVSSPASCFYTPENGKITVGGNVVLGSVDPASTVAPVTVDLFKNNNPSTPTAFNANNGSVQETAAQASYNSQAYTQRITQLVTVSQNIPITPDEAQERINDGTDEVKALQDYYKERTRRVPFAEDPDPNSPALTSDTTAPQGDNDNDDIRPRDEWHYPINTATGAENNSLTLRPTQPPARDPEALGTDEELLGDRILVGNGLPAKWWNGQKFVDYYDIRDRQPVGGDWDAPPGTPRTPRTRKTQFVPLSDLGDTDRDGFWEQAAAKPPEQALDAIGGLRVVTGAGIYDAEQPGSSFLPRPAVNPIRDNLSTEENEEGGLFKIAFPDSMPMWDDTNKNGIPEITDKSGDLIMRATAVYHYRESSYPNTGATDTDYPDPNSANQTPIACVSSYYNPSTRITAQNRETLQDGSPAPTWTADPNGNESPISPSGLPNANGLSNNGISYPVPTEAINLAASVGAGGKDGDKAFNSPAPEPPSTVGADLRARLNYQANLIYPDGRFVNEPLRAALQQIDDSKPLTLAHQSSLVSTICALKILDGDLAPNNSVIPHGTIYETSFLDARQVKALEDPDPTSIPNNYDLSIEQRQPLEIRATVLDLDKLRKKAIAGQAPMNTVVPDDEYLLPDSGIIYATREDALQDLSVDPDATMVQRKLNSPVDFILDPTRRPNGIMLINGTELARGGDANEYKPEEKGLILATNLPAYVKANARGFNLHQNASSGAPLEEFEEPLAANFSNFYTGRTTPSTLFACRKDQPGLNCDPGDLWRPATVLADSVTLLSNNFRFGFRNEGDYDLRKNVDTLANNLVLGGYDFDGSGTALATDDAVDENQVGFDLNGNNNATDTDVKETEITVSAARKLNGFFDNNYLTSADWSDETVGSNYGFPKLDFDPTPGNQGSSYVNNFVTPIQRRADFGEYVMEICRKPLVEQCGPTDWVVGYDLGGTPGVLDPGEEKLMAWELITATENAGSAYVADKLGAGTTASLAKGFDADGDGIEPIEIEADRRYPRRVAFLRTPFPAATDSSGNVIPPNRLVLDSSGRPVPIGINNAGKVEYFPYVSMTTINRTGTGSAPFPPYAPFSNTNFPRIPPNPGTLWFKTATNAANPTSGGNYGYSKPLFYQTPLAGTAGVGTTEQPLLVPVLQLHLPTQISAQNYFSFPTDPKTVEKSEKNWMQTPTNTTFNLIIAAGDTPSRNATADTSAEFNGGMPNFPIFLENWEGLAPVTAKIKGSFIQVKRSAYATAPYVDLLTTTAPNPGIFGYPQIYRTDNSGGRSPYYTAPNRDWGFDVGLLPQLPDAFSQRITTPSAGDPNKFYRELSRNDEWVKTLLCAAEVVDVENGTVGDYAVKDEEQRPRGCLDIGNYN